MSYIYEKILLPFDYEETPVPRLKLWAFLRNVGMKILTKLSCTS